ncbi:MAG: glycosyltransferase family 39 protein [Candidatus Aenigmarchaeota archaeon]|nr:glycosyltransferase family 39 protein [Candidatus Aenigmarchaeota archaeon]
MSKKQSKEKDKEVEFEIKNPEILVLSFALVLFFILQLRVTLNNPIAFGDEGYHGMLQRYIGTNIDYPKWHPYYSNPLSEGGVSDNPLWHLIGASLFMIFRSDVVIKILPPFIGTICVGFASYFLGKKIFNNKTIAFVTAIIAVTIPSMVTYSVLNYKDAMMTFYFTLFLLFFILAVQHRDKKNVLLTGIFAGLLILGKTSGYAMIPSVFILFFLYDLIQNNFKKSFSLFFPIFLITTIVVSGFFIRNIMLYETPICSAFVPFFSMEKCSLEKIKYDHKFSYEGRTVQAGTELTPFKLGLSVYLSFAYGILWFLPLLMFLGIFYFIQSGGKEKILIILTIVSFIPIYYIAFNSRAEDTARWLLPLSPVVALIAAVYSDLLYKFIEKNVKILTILFFIFVIVFSYINFSQKLQIMDQVKKFSPAFLQACEWVKKNTEKDSRFGAIIYMPAAGYNCDRNIAAGGPDVVLSQNKTLALSVLKIQEADYLFIQKAMISWDDAKLSERHPISFVRFLEANPDAFVKVYETGLSLDVCYQQGGCDGVIIYKINYENQTIIPAEKLVSG